MTPQFCFGDHDRRAMVGGELRERRVRHERYSHKLMDAIDASASSLARSYAENSAKPFWVPEL